MKIIIKEKLRDTPRNLLRRCGYAEIHDRRSGEVSYVRRLGREFYPRLHAYPEELDSGLVINLHLDMKKPSYEGFHAHSGEYEGPLLDKEAERIKKITLPSPR
jgi:hypothetical protein